MELILETWRSFDSARADQPLPTARHLALLAEPLPRAPGDAAAALDAAARVLDVSLTQARPRFFAWIGGSGLEIGVLGDALMASHDVNVAVSSGAATPLERQTVRWDGRVRRLLAGRRRPDGGRGHDLEPHGADRRARAGAPGVALRGHQRAPARALLLGRGALLGAPRRRGARYRRAQRPRDRDRRRPAHGPPLRRGDRRRPPAGIVPVAVVATAGTTLTGAVDDLRRSPRSAREREVWLHVDGAYGLPAARRSSPAPLRGPRARRLGNRRRAQVALRAEGLQRPPRPRPRRARSRLHPRRELHPPHRPRGHPSGRPHARVFAAAERAQAVARLPRSRRGGDPRGDRAQPAPGAPARGGWCATIRGSSCSSSPSSPPSAFATCRRPRRAATPRGHNGALAAADQRRGAHPARPGHRRRRALPARLHRQPPHTARTTSARSSRSCARSARSARGSPRRAGAPATPDHERRRRAPRHGETPARAHAGARRSLSARGAPRGADPDVRPRASSERDQAAIIPRVTSGWNCRPRWRPWRKAAGPTSLRASAAPPGGTLSCS